MHTCTSNAHLLLQPYLRIPPIHALKCFQEAQARKTKKLPPVAEPRGVLEMDVISFSLFQVFHFDILELHFHGWAGVKLEGK